jgi:hypothetical protein
MVPSYIAEEMARQHTEALTIAARRAAESARFKRMNRQPSRFSRSIGGRLMSMGARLAGRNTSAVQRGTAQEICY